MADLKKAAGKFAKAFETASNEAEAAYKAAKEAEKASKMEGVLKAKQAPMTTPSGTGLPLMPRSQGMYTPGVPQVDLPRMPMVDKARAKGEKPKYTERMQDLLDSPTARKKVDTLIEKGDELGMREWYGTEPLRQVAMDIGMTQPQFDQFLAQMASASQRNPVDQQNRMGSYLWHLSQTGGLPEDAYLLTNKIKRGKQAAPEGTAIELPPGYGSLAQGDIFSRGKQIAAGDIEGALPPDKKLGTFYRNYQGNLKPVTVDVNAVRGPIIERGDPRWLASKLVEKDEEGNVIATHFPRKQVESGLMSLKEAKARPGFWEAAPSGSEYAGFEDLWQRAAKRKGISPAEAQALGWYGSADVTALKTKPELYIDNLERMIRRTAEQTGQNPRQVMEDVLRGKTYLKAKGGAVDGDEAKTEDLEREWQLKEFGYEGLKEAQPVPKTEMLWKHPRIEAPKKKEAYMLKAADGGKVSDYQKRLDAMIAKEMGYAEGGVIDDMTPDTTDSGSMDWGGEYAEGGEIKRLPWKAAKGGAKFADGGFTNEQIANYIGEVQSRGGTAAEIDAEIAAAMDNFGVSPEQVARATGTTTDYIQNRYNAANAGGKYDTTPEMGGVILAGDSWLSTPDHTDRIRNQIGGDVDVTNVAVGGSKTTDVLNQLDSFIGQGGRFRPDTTVMLDIGGNDLLSGVTPEEIERNINRISSTLGDRGVNVILSGAPTVRSIDDITGSTSLALDPLYQRVVDANKNVTLVNSMPSLLNQKNLVDDTGFHMNEVGRNAFDASLAGAYRKSKGMGNYELPDEVVRQYVADNGLTVDEAKAIAQHFDMTPEQVEEILTTQAAQGGEIKALPWKAAKGGFAKAAKAIEKASAEAEALMPAVNRIDMNYKDVTKRIPELTEAAQKVAKGEMSPAEYDAMVNSLKPVTPYGFVPQPATAEDAMRALTENKRAMFGKTNEMAAGEQADLRLDIPAYKDHGVWVNSIHRKDAPTVYGSVSSVKNATMIGAPEKAMRVATGETAKAPFAVIRGEWNPMDEATAVKNAQKYLKHKDWRQVGYDPERHGYFYDRHTMEPIEGAEEVIQIGPLVLAKKPRYGKKEEQKFDTGGGAFTNTDPEALYEAEKGTPSKAKLMAEILARMAKEQAKEEAESLGKKGATMDLINRGIVAPLAGMPVDLINMGLEGVDSLRDLASGKRVENRLASEKPFLGSEYLKDKMVDYGMTTDTDRPMMETGLSILTPSAAGAGKGVAKTGEAVKKGVRAAESGLNAATSAVRRPFTPATVTVEAVAPDLAKFKPRQWQDTATQRMISGEGAPVSMSTMGGRKTTKRPGQGVYLNEAGQLETNPLVAVDVPFAGNLETNKALRTDIAQAGTDLAQEAMAAHRFVPMATNEIKDASAMLIKTKKGAMTDAEVKALGESLPGMIVAHNPRLGGVVVAPFEMTKGQIPQEFLDAQTAAQAILGKKAKIVYGKAEPGKDLLYMGRDQYATEGAGKPSGASTKMRQRLQRAEKRLFPESGRSQSGLESMRDAQPATAH